MYLSSPPKILSHVHSIWNTNVTPRGEDLDQGQLNWVSRGSSPHTLILQPSNLKSHTHLPIVRIWCIFQLSTARVWTTVYIILHVYMPWNSGKRQCGAGDWQKHGGATGRCFLFRRPGESSQMNLVSSCQTWCHSRGSSAVGSSSVQFRALCTLVGIS